MSFNAVATLYKNLDVLNASIRHCLDNRDFSAENAAKIEKQHMDIELAMLQQMTSIPSLSSPEGKALSAFEQEFLKTKGVAVQFKQISQQQTTSQSQKPLSSRTTTTTTTTPQKVTNPFLAAPISPTVNSSVDPFYERLEALNRSIDSSALSQENVVRFNAEHKNITRDVIEQASTTSVEDLKKVQEALLKTGLNINTFKEKVSRQQAAPQQTTTTTTIPSAAPAVLARISSVPVAPKRGSSTLAQRAQEQGRVALLSSNQSRSFSLSQPPASASLPSPFTTALPKNFSCPKTSPFAPALPKQAPQPQTNPFTTTASPSPTPKKTALSFSRSASTRELVNPDSTTTTTPSKPVPKKFSFSGSVSTRELENPYSNTTTTTTTTSPSRASESLKDFYRTPHLQALYARLETLNDSIERCFASSSSCKEVPQIEKEIDDIKKQYQVREIRLREKTSYLPEDKTESQEIPVFLYALVQTEQKIAELKFKLAAREQDAPRLPSLSRSTSFRKPANEELLRSLGWTESTPLAIEEKVAQMKALAKEELIVPFYDDKTFPLTGCFGNFHICENPIPFRDEGSYHSKEELYSNSEAIFQMQKYSDQPKVQAQFKGMIDGDTALQLAKPHTNPMTEERLAEWNSKDPEVNDVAAMKRALRAKFGCNQELQELLLATGDAYLVEQQPDNQRADKRWSNGFNGSGENMLGICLMEVREELGGKGVVPPPFSEATCARAALRLFRANGQLETTTQMITQPKKATNRTKR